LEYDVVVVGAGPAGSSTAKSAARMGLSVLLVDSKIEIGVPCKCGEFVPSLNEMRRLAPDASNLDEMFDPPSNCIVNRTKYIRFVFGDMKEITIPFEGIVVERKSFDKHLANEAARAGADISPKTSITDIDTERMILTGRDYDKKIEVKTKLIAGADGAVSLVRKKFNLPYSTSQLDYAVGYQYEMVNIDHDPDYVDMYYSEQYAPGTYAWIIPKGKDIANVGTGVRLPFVKKGLTVRDYQRNFVTSKSVQGKLRNAKITAIKAGYIPVGGPIDRTYAKNAVVVGDAAGQTIPTVGGGIPSGLICGKIAGQALADNIQRGADLVEYEAEWKRQIGTVLENSLRLRRMGDTIFKSNSLLSFSLKSGVLNEELINHFVLCKIDTKMRLLEKSLQVIAPA
jgi:digeranylgeranylglycerophospholipid reductase